MFREGGVKILNVSQGKKLKSPLSLLVVIIIRRHNTTNITHVPNHRLYPTHGIGYINKGTA